MLKINLKNHGLGLAIMLTGLILIVNSCKKEVQHGEKLDPARIKEMLAYKNGPKAEIINFNQFRNSANLNALGTLKQEFIKTLPSKSKQMAIHTAQTYLGFNIITDSITVIKAKGHTSYVFPVVLSSKRARSFQNLTIDESAEGTVVFVNTYTPTQQWVEDWKKGHAGKFDGEISVTYLDINKDAAGGSSGKNTQAKKLSSLKNPNRTADAQYCTTTTYFYLTPYLCGSGNHWPWDIECILTGDEAAGYTYSENTVTTCEDQDSGGSGSGATTPTPPGGLNPCPGTPPPTSSKKSMGNKVMVVPPSECDEEEPVVDCAGVPGGTAYMADCGCIGGTTGITECLIKEIKIDTSARKCLDTLSKGIISSANVLSILRNIFSDDVSSNNVSGMISRISQSADWNVVIKEGTIGNETNYNGDTITTNALTSVSQGKVFINFNKSYLNQATNLSVARTMIHELMHAYFTYGLAMISDPGYQKFVEANDLLFKKNGNPLNDQNDAQHQQIANKYVTQLSTLLEAYAISAGIQSPDPSMSLSEYCKDMAWGGLKDTKAYRKYAQNKTRIEQHILNEAKNNINSSRKKGC